MKKKGMFVFLTGMCIGILAANLFCEDYSNRVMILSSYLLEKYPAMNIEGERLFQYCIQIRLMPVLYIGIFSLTMFGGIYLMGYLLWLGFAFGALLSVATIRFGLKGILLCVVGMLPQFIIYVPVTAASLYYGNEIYRRLYVEYESDIHSGRGKRSFFLRYALIFMVLFIVSIIGVILESYVNPLILKKFLKLF